MSRFSVAVETKVDTLLKQSSAVRGTPAAFSSSSRGEREPRRMAGREGAGRAYLYGTRGYTLGRAGLGAAWTTRRDRFFPLSGVPERKNMETCSRMLKNSALHAADEVFPPGVIRKGVIRRHDDAPNLEGLRIGAENLNGELPSRRFRDDNDGESNQYKVRKEGWKKCWNGFFGSRKTAPRSV